MRFVPTKYSLMNVADGHTMDDAGWTLADPESKTPSLVRAVYQNRLFEPRQTLRGLYKYADCA